MRRRNFFYLIIVLLFGFISPVWAAIRDVCPSGCSYNTIQEAIDSAADGDEVLVSDGTYTENITTYINSSITIRSVSGAANTIIDGGGSGTVFTFNPSVNLHSVLDGFTIRSGASTNGAGIICDQASPTIKNCTIQSNIASGKGGGLYLYKSGSSIENCTIISNTAGTGGGGVYIRSGVVHLINCQINSNTSSGSGGGVDIVNVSSSLTNCLIRNNSALNGGGISTAGRPVITNCTVPDNTATGKGGGIYSPSSESIIVNSIFWGNGEEVYGSPTVTYSIIQSGYTGTGNVDADPLFVDAGGKDYSLQSASPAIDVADSSSAPANDIDATVRPQLLGDDMGAYEFVLGCQPRASFTGDSTRILVNGTVNFDASGSYNRGGASYSWDFGDGDSDTGETPSHQYVDAGVYTVNLTMTNGCGSNILSRENYITAKPSGNTFYVRGDFSTIAEAINASIDGDTVITEPGTYIENIDFGGRNITVESSAGAATTIIDGGSIGSVVTFSSGEAATSTLKGFTLKQGKAKYGGGIYIENSSPTIIDCIITSNWAGSGGGIYANNATPIVRRTEITQNTSGQGGGVALFSAPAQLTNCLIADNTAGTGAGVYDETASPVIVNCTIYGNTSTLSTGYGMYTFLSSAVIKNTILWDASPEISEQYSSLTITYSDILGGYSGTGNISSNPLLVDPDGGDYTPQAGSDLEDSGTNTGAPTLDLAGDTRDANVDIGAVEYFFINPNDTNTVTSYSLSETTSVVKGQQYAMFGFNLASTPGVSNLNNVKIYFDAASTGDQNDISSVSLYEDNDGNGVYDGSENSVGSMAWNAGGYYEMQVDPFFSIATSPGTDFIMVVTVDAGAVSNNTLRFKFNNDDYVEMDSPDSVDSFSGFSGNQTYTIQPNTVTAASYALSESASIVRGGSYAMFGFTLTSSPGISNLETVEFYIDFGSTGDQNDLSSMALYEDDDANGVYDGTEPLVVNIVWNVGGYYELSSNPDYAVSTSGTDFIVVGTVDLSAATGETLIFIFYDDDYIWVDSPDTMNSFAEFSGDIYTVSDWWNVNYQNRRQLTVDQAPADYVVLLHYDGSTSPTANAMYNSSLSSTPGDDFRIVYNDTEIDRHLASFTSSSIDIWFKVQATIGAGGDSTDYKLYYGYAAGVSPSASTDNVYGSGHELIAHYDNSSLGGVDGEAPTTSTGISYTTGVRVQGAVLIDNDVDNLKYSSTDLFGATAPDAGTIEFWFKPSAWIWTANGQYTFFEGTGSQNFIIYKNNATIVAEISDSGGTAIQCINTIPGSWSDSISHHIAFSWDWSTGNGYLFIDGVLDVTDNQASGTGATISAHPRIGNDIAGGNFADGSFDQFMTWNYAKTTAAEISYYDPETGVVSGSESELRNDAENQTSQRTDASHMVDINYEGRHVDGNQAVTYVAADCEYSTDGSTWFDMTTAETTENFTSSWADYTYVWDAGTDLPNTEDSTVYARLRVNENSEDSNQWAETTFVVDTINPGAPSSLTDTGLTNITIDLSWTKSSGDGNWYRYEIYYKACDPCVITRGGGGETLKSETDVNTQTTTLTGLSPSTTYSINIWAVDDYGHAVSATEITAATISTPFAPELQNDAENPTSQRTDSSDLVDVKYEGRDQNGDSVTYVAADCEYSTDGATWYDMTTGESTESFTSNWVDYTYVWDVGTDLPNTEDNTVYARLKVNDGVDDSNQWAETVFAIDVKDPGAPSSFASTDEAQDTLDLSWTKSSGDGNWYRYEIYYKACDPCTITRGDNGETLKSEADVNTQTTTLTGLTANTTYSINIWAVDNYGHVVSDTQIIVTTDQPDTVTTTSYSLSEPASVDRDNTYALFGFTLTSSPATSNLSNIKIYFDAVSTGDQNDLTSVALYEDDDGVYDGTEPLVSSINWNAAGYYELSGDPDYTISSSGTNFIMVGTIDLNSAVGDTLCFKFNNDDYVAVDLPGSVNSFTGFVGDVYTFSDWWNFNYQSRRQLTVDQAPVDYVVLLHYDGSTSPTSNAMYTSSLSATAGDDFRIVYNDTEIDRHLASFTSSSIDIWFKVQAAIGAGGDSTNYKLYYGYAAVAGPPATTDNVYGSGHELIAHYDNSSPDGVYGETPSTDSGTSYTTGVRVQGGVFIDNDADILKYSSTDLFGATAPDAGTIEFWFKPNAWIWTDNSQYIFFDGTGSQDFKIIKDRGKLKAYIQNSSGTTISCILNPVSAAWNNSNSHHIAFSWDWSTGNGYLFTDGVLSATDTQTSGTSATIRANPRIGNDLAGGLFADGSFDQFMTRNYAKTTAAEISYYDPEPGVVSGSESELRNDAENPTSQRADASHMVDINYEGRHVDGAEVVTYVAADCEYSTDGSTWLDMTTAETTENFTSNWADYTYVWDAGTDLPNTEDSTVYARLRGSENGENSNQWAETTFIVDTISPGAPSSLTDTGSTNITIDLGWTKSSGDGNWYRYEIYYKACSCAITRGGGGESLETVADVNTQTGTISGLNPSTTYSINIWAVDDYGHAVPAGQITAVTASTPVAPELQDDAENQTAQRTDASDIVDVRYEGRDQNGDSVTYVAADCEYSLEGLIWFDMTTAESTENFTSNWADYTYVWDVATDLPNTEDSSVYARLKVNDSGSDSDQWEEIAFAVDTIFPGATSNFASPGDTQSSIDLSWTKSSGDGNWYRYEIYYKACSCAITRGGGGETLKSEVDVSTQTTTLTGLDSDTTYSINIWAVDSFGHVVSDTQITAATTPPDTVTTVSYSLSEPTSIKRGGDYAMFGFTLTSSPDVANVSNIKIYIDAVSTGDQNDLSSVALYDDDDANGIYDATEPLVGNISWNAGGYYELSSSPDYTVSATGTDFIMVGTVDAGAAVGNTLRFAFNNDDYVAVDSPDTVNSFSGFLGATYTVNDWWNVNYQNRRPLTVDQAPVDYVVLLHYDAGTTPSASVMYNNSLSATEGDDFRIVYNDTEIDRHIASFTSSSIDIWFKVQAAIGAGGDSTNYKLYYGYAAGASPPATTDNVYGSGHELIAHYDNSSPDGVDGETPSTDSGTSYATGVRVQGAIFIDNSNDDLRYSSTDLFGSTAPDAGTVEFWFQPNGWLWTDRIRCTFIDGTGSQVFKIYKNRSKFEVQITDSGGSIIWCKLNSLPAGWNNSDPHHIAFSWDWASGDGYLFLDGVLETTDNAGTGTGATISANPRIGNNLAGVGLANGSFDQFKTWNYAKTTASEISYYNPEPGVVTGSEE